MFEIVARLIDPISLLLVGGGTIAVTALRSTAEGFKSAFRALKPLVKARPAADAIMAERAVRQIQRISDIKGIALADRVDTSSLFVRRAAVKLADCHRADEFAAWARADIEERGLRHDAAINVWKSAADAAPSMGMIGTVLGLIGMFAAMDDPATLGPAMAIALLTTLYGLILSSVVAVPVAGRLEQLSLAERRWQEAVFARLEALARAEETPPLAAWPKRSGARG
ncbi:MotA/TolQ/ExbB proton channel family protein [Allosphingosinicella flava]|uniref:MotA/TolQ/ExbB proton channel family protein n=1 Tax=Allosphingosinicella flava TaxID=2771430 RepID=A0A7T2GLQ5_9SPHN|nr:MotA/TolQ/ExbB proton channel family protein [Sphingosinicella flava]QPQ56190.1 MotA/TolQ/ExbB proton channel family protein [Sphingosinicella flava]